MATLIEEVLTEKGFAMIEAGTGTGKSRAYAVPAILSGKRVLISTAKKALQKQLRDDDLPDLMQRLAPGQNFASLKGKNNYVCKLRLSEFLTSDAASRFSREDVRAFETWAEDDELGELDDYETNVDFSQYVRVSECVARKCPNADGCGYRRAKARATAARIVVVNHALLAFDLVMGGGKIVGKYDALIIDEAHQAAKYFREAYTCRIHGKQPDMLRKLLQDAGVHVPAELDGQVVNFLNKLPVRGPVQSTNNVVEAALDIYRSLDVVKRQLIIEGVWSDTTGDEEGESLRDPRELSRLRAAATITQRMMQACDVCVDKLDLKLDADGQEIATKQDFVMYVESKNSRGEMHKEYVATPIEIGQFMAPKLRAVGTVVFTSATLTTSGTFDYACREFGLKPDEIRIKEAMPHAFNYRTNSCLFVSPDTIEYRRDQRHEYWTSCADVMHKLLQASKGGAFVLCASFEDMHEFYERLLATPNRNYNVRSQSGNVNTLLAWFQSDPTAVALGVKSIWEGVDIPGLGLRLVIIPRLPFPNPDDPVFTARKAKYVQGKVAKGVEARMADLSAWQHYDLQEAIMDFKQGAGRLIRRENDRGVIAVLDKRLYGNTKRYGAAIRASVPHPLTYDLKGTQEFLRILAQQYVK
jgi:ATP-dependent DNA helicase DinG